MPPESLAPHELFRLRLEEQLRRDVELLYQAYLTKLRAYETVARAQGEIDGGLPPLAPLALALPDLPPGLEVAVLPASLPAPPPAAATPAQPPAPAPKPSKSSNYVIQDAVVEALGRLGEVFDKKALRRALGFEPTRSSLHAALERLVSEGVLTVEYGEPGHPNHYRRVAREVPPAAPPEPPPAAPARGAAKKGPREKR